MESDFDTDLPFSMAIPSELAKEAPEVITPATELFAESALEITLLPESPREKALASLAAPTFDLLSEVPVSKFAEMPPLLLVLAVRELFALAPLRPMEESVVRLLLLAFVEAFAKFTAMP